MKKIITLGLFGIFLTSCSTVSHTYRSSDIVGSQIVANEVVVDTKIDMQKKIEAVSSKRDSEAEAMHEAYYEAITKNNIDVVIDPIFEVTSTDRILFFGGKSTARLTGFGAKYENSRSKIDAIKELKSIDANDIQKFNAIYNTSETGKQAEKKSTGGSSSKKGWIIGGAILAALALITLL
jgi:hypothetical protein